MDYAGFVDKLSARLDRLDPSNISSVLSSFARQRALLETIIQSIQEGILVISAEGNVTYANKTAETMLGFDISRVRGRPVERFLPDIDWNELSRREDASWEKVTTAEIEIYRPRHRIVQLSAFPLEAGALDDNAPGTVAILRDVTRERADSAEVLESERMHAVRVLAASLAHEIGNPLNALGIHLQLLTRDLRRVPDEETRQDLAELVQVAVDEVARLDLILSKFLRALRPSAPDLAPCDLREVLQNSLRVMKTDIEEHRIRVSVDYPQNLPKIQGDAQQLQQVFFNLIKNAVQAMKDGGALDIRLSADDRDLSIAFRDTGSGISKDFFRQMFQPFQTAKPNGNGIGLTIVQRIVQDHGGRIDVASKAGEGACFTLVFPLADRKLRRITR